MNEQVEAQEITFPKESVLKFVTVNLRTNWSKALTPFYAWGKTKQEAQGEMIMALRNMVNEQAKILERLSKENERLQQLERDNRSSVSYMAKRLGIIRK